MRRFFTLTKAGLFIVAMMVTAVAGAQTIAWNFSDGTANPSTTSVVASSAITTANNLGTISGGFVVSASVSSGYTGASGTFNAGIAAKTGALNTAAGGSTYYEFTLTPPSGNIATLTAISFGVRSTSTGSQAYTLRSNLDNYATDIATGTVANNSSWSLKSHTNLSVASGTGTPVTFRIYFYNGSGNASNGTINTRIDDLNLSVSAAPPVISNNADLAALSTSAGPLSPAFSASSYAYSVTTANANSSATISFTKANTNATVTASLNGGAFGNPSASFPLSVGNNTIDVKVVAQDGVTQKDYIISINRAAAATPLLLISGNPNFGSICLNNASVQGFLLDGSSLDGSNINIGALNGFSYAETSNGTYTNTLSLSYTGNAFTGKQFFVKFTPTAAQSYNGDLAINGGGTGILVSASAAGINTAPTVATGGNQVAGTSATLNGTISVTGCTNVTSFGFEYSTISGIANGTGISVTAASLNGGAFSKTVTGLAAATTYYYKAFATNAGGTTYGAEGTFTTSSVVPVIMASQPLLRYTENFNAISGWAANFASGTGANRFSSVGVNVTAAAIPSPTRITTSSATFASGSSGGVQKGTGSLVLLSTGSTDNSSSVAVDFYMDFTGVNAGTLSFDWAAVANGTGDRPGSLRVYGSVDGVNYTELTSASVLNFANNVPATGTVNNIALPAYFSHSPGARLRFYYHNGTGSGSGSRPKISIDNLVVTAVASTPCATPSAAPTSLVFSSVGETSVNGSFTAASPSANEYLVIMSTNSTLTNNPIDGQTYTIGDNVGDGTVIAKGAELNFTADGLTGATTYYFFVFSVNSVCTGGPKYLTTDVLEEDVTTVAGLPSCTAPVSQPSGLVTVASINSIQGSFTATAADEYVVLQSTGGTFSGTLANGVVYNAGSTIGNAIVVQRSSATTFNATGLAPATQYYYTVFSVNAQGCVNGPVYNTVDPLAGTATTLPLPVCSIPSAQPSDIAFNASYNNITATFNAGGGSNLNYLVVMSTSPTLSATPVDNTDYSAGASLGGGTVVSNGTSTSFIATNLTNATTYYFFVFAANKNCTGGTKYLTASPLSGSATTTNAPLNNIYFGTLHSHTAYSDGQKDNAAGTPADAYEFASHSLGMDFLGISEHNHFSTVNNPGNEIANYHAGSAQAAAFNAAHPNFLALYGMEYGVISNGGHVLVYGDGLTELFGWESNVNGNVGPNYDVYVPKSTYLGVEGLFARVNDYKAKNAFTSLAHPNNADYNNLSNIAYDAAADSAISGVAVESGPATSKVTNYSDPSSMSYVWYYNKLLSKGYHLGPTIDHDNHYTTFGRHTPARTAVIAPELTQSAIIKAVHDMHFYATEDMDSKVDFTINTRIMGSVFEDRNAPSIAVNLTDATDNVGNALIRVMYGEPGSNINPVVIDSVFGSSLSYVDNALANHATGYYYIDITHNGKRILTSPIWYTRTCASAGDTTATVCGSFDWYGTVYTSSTTVTKTFTTAGGCDSTVTLHLTINNPPSAVTLAAVGSDSGCPGTGVALAASANDGGNGAVASYKWMQYGNLVATTTTANYTATASGPYTVTAVNTGNCAVTSNAITVTVSDDVAPVANASTLPVITGACAATVFTAPTATDNCAGTITGTTSDPLSYTTQGTYTIHWTFSDGNGNTSTQDQTVIVSDTEKPTITAPSEVSVVNDAGQCGATINNIGTPVTADNCGVASVTNDHPSNYYPVGITIVTWKVTDVNGNTTDTATQRVTVIDNELPTITVNNITVNNNAGACEATVVLAAPATADNCGVASVTNDHPSNIFPVGTTTVTWTVTDNNGWTNTATQLVTVKDAEKPTITAPSEVSVVNDPGACGATILNIGTPVTADNCGVAGVSNDHPSNYYPVGTTIVRWSVTDVHGNVTDTATQKITVIDNELPTITVSNKTVAADAGCGANVVLQAPQTSDNCGVASVTNDHPSAYFPVGNTTVTWTVTDNNGWMATATQVITVTDQQAPTVVTKPVTVYLNAAGVAGIGINDVNNGSTDNCSIALMSLNKTGFNCADLGANTVTLSVTDASGNVSSATAVVTVKDNTLPTLTTQPVTVYLDASGTATVTALQLIAASADNCGVSSYSVSKTSFNCSNLGANTVTVTVVDASGNSNAANATVTVKSNILPVVTAVPAQAFCVNGSSNYTIPALAAVGNCGAVTTSYTITGATTRSGTTNNASGTFNTGVSTITWTVKDASGNVSTSSTTVTISALPATAITISSPDAFCNKLTLTANTTGAGATYKWTSGAATVATTQQLNLGQTNADGVYQVTVTLNGCTSAPAAYNYQKQNLVSSYTLLAIDKIDLGTNNTVASGSVGVTGLKGEVELGSFSTINSPGSFVKAKNIDKNGLFITIGNPIYAAATGIVLPAMQLNTANTNNLPNKDVAQNSVSTVNGNYKNLTLKKGSRTTLTGTTFGTIRVEQGAQVTFTAPVISIDQLNVVKGPRNGYSYVRFSGDAKVLVSAGVSIGSQVFVNPDNNNVTFYMGDKKSDDEKFVVNGGDTKVNANIYIPKGKLQVNGGYSYGSYGLFGLGDCDRDDDEARYFGLGNAYVYMTGAFIAENITGNGKNVIWNSFDCSAPPVTVLNTVQQVNTQSTGSEKATVTSEETLKVTVLPNPSTSYFTLKIESRYETPVNIRVMDSRGRVVDARSKVGANSTIQLGHDYAGGTYFAELTQGGLRKVVQLVKVRG